MPTGHLVAIVLGSILGVLIFAAVAFILCKRRGTGDRTWAAAFSRSSSKQTLSDDALARQRAHSSFYQTDRSYNRHSFPQSGVGTDIHGSSAIFDPFATPAPSANHSSADLLASSASVRTEVVVTNDRTGATVMLWSPSDRFLASASTPNGPEPSFHSMMRRPMPGSELSPTISTPRTPPLSDSSPSSIRPLLPPSPDPSSSFLPETTPARKRSIFKKPFRRQLPPLPVPRAPLPATPAEYPLLETDAGRVDESYFDRSRAGSAILPSSSPPPKYER